MAEAQVELCHPGRPSTNSFLFAVKIKRKISNEVHHKGWTRCHFKEVIETWQIYKGVVNLSKGGCMGRK